jgi:hypothetical protein
VVDEVSVEGELADERIDLTKGQVYRGPPFEVMAEEAIGRGAALERGLSASSTDARPYIFASERTPRMRRIPKGPH